MSKGSKQFTWLKCLRIFLTIFGVCAFFWQFSDSMSKFRDTATSVSTSFTDDDEATFPPVIFCAHDGFNQGQLLKIVALQFLHRR